MSIFPNLDAKKAFWIKSAEDGVKAMDISIARAKDRGWDDVVRRHTDHRERLLRRIAAIKQSGDYPMSPCDAEIGDFGTRKLT